MSAMMGGQAGSQEDMFAKLESMRAVIAEVNSQFKDPVRTYVQYLDINLFLMPLLLLCFVTTGEDNLHLRLHLRVSFAV